MATHNSTYSLGQFSIDENRSLKVVIIGAGFSGIAAGIRFPQRVKNIDLYPGLSCDIPSHTYQYTFEVNPEWSSFYAPGPEIRAYLERVVEKYKLAPYIKLQHELTHARYDEAEAKWYLRIRRPGPEFTQEEPSFEEFEDTADFVFCAAGCLSRWSWPDIDGLKDFQGKLIHSADWDTDNWREGVEDWKDKRVGVIGVGSSAIQIVPALQPYVGRLYNFVRGKTWLVPPFFADRISELTGRDPGIANYAFEEEDKEKFRGSDTWDNNQSVYNHTLRNPEREMQDREAITACMKDRLAKKPWIADHIIPGFPVACRRLTPGPGYLEALCEENVDFTPKDIRRVTATGIETMDGQHYDLDIIVCATGYDTSYMFPFPVVGRSGLTLQQRYDPRPVTYLSMCTDGFPNWFFGYGPNSSVGAGSLLIIFERQVEYAAAALFKMQRERLKSMEVKREAVEDFEQYIEAYFPGTVYSAKCRSWYKLGKEEGPVVGLWPGSCLHAVRALERPRWEDYNYEHLDGVRNRFYWLGDGSTYDEKHMSGDRAWYLSDEEVDYPPDRKILDMLPDRPPQVTFSCDNATSTCSFQFWTAQQESFYCGLDSCTSESKPGYDTNSTVYACDKIQCKCIPDRFLCGEDGSVDISDFLVEEIRGPATFGCRTGQGCRFEEPAMNSLINDIFGDAYITLNCDGGECLHYSQVPGYQRPAKPDNTKWIALSSAGAGLIVILTVAILWYVGHSRSSNTGPIALPSDPRHPPSHPEHVPATVHFKSLSYTLPNGLEVLKDVRGVAHPGSLTAVMGASGSGKSTLIDILAHRSKIGSVSGSILINGRSVTPSQVRHVSGYVDQEDTLMETLTVYETVLYSALLRLPREMPEEEKIARVYGTLEELGIRGIMDRRIGGSGKRSISGGEKRRVSIACELVTSPSILFLDEPTSGLDSYNAQSVIESLSNLARTYKRTVILTIHQPRSGIVALFDELILLAKGRCVWAGPMRTIRAPQLVNGLDGEAEGEVQGVSEWLESIGKGCPAGFNIADYLIDLTVSAANDFDDLESPSLDLSSSATDLPSNSTGTDEERALLSGSSHLDETELQTRVPSSSSRRMSISSTIKRKTSQLIDVVRNGRISPVNRGLSEKLAELVTGYEKSSTARRMEAEFEAARSVNSSALPSGIAGEISAPSNGTISDNGERVGMMEMRDVVGETGLLRGRRSASWGTQFRILSGRAFKNLYRDPALLTAHYLGSIALALICGLFFHNVRNDIAGFQNRLGIFFFSLALFGFSCLSSLGLFANERILFMRERANGYYSTFTYFSSKVLFDILPLRLVPPLLFGGIVYGLVGLVATVPAFWKFMLTLVLFNLTTASVILLLSIAFESTSLASLVGTLIMLFNLLFTGLLINRETVTPFLQWLHTVSFFHAAFEALAVNELRYLQLKEIRYGVELDVPAATILSIFGLRAQSFWWPNISLLGIFFATFTIASFLMLHFYVKEKR
ncbi:hypothetical protein JVU11DRAFT_4047 [Chiua virens]|nr:hypothetical protein JVU11DRAFT_4047 [Chiua virens]